MTPAAIIERAAAEGVSLALSPAGTIKASGKAEAVNRWLATIREHKPAIVAALAGELFEFAPPGDIEALEERACIIAERCGIDHAQARQEARWQAERERAWRAFRLNAERILAIPEAQRPALLERYEAEAASRYGASVARDMAETMRRWVARPFRAMPG
jgi:hypothetical protein